MERQKHTFLVNFYVEGDAESGWRHGSVEHLASRRRLYFRDIAELMEFLATCAGRRDTG